MGSTFNPQILVDKLAKLNNSQASIETLSHWCIFHMNKAKYVVETWDRQFHCSPREQRLAFLYLANDILQNSRRKGSEFVGEFWKVLPNALHDVVKSGDEAGRNAALRLIGIWEERKVFGTRAQNLKDEFLGKHLEKNNREVKNLGNKLPAGSMLDKIVSSYHAVYGGHMDEDVSLGKCRKAMSYIEKVEKEIGPDMHQDQYHEVALVEELQGHHAILRDSIRELLSIESLRANIVSQLREAILEQESKLEQVRNQLQVANSLSERAGDICQQLRASNAKLVEEQNLKVADTSTAPQNFVAGEREQSAPAMYAREVSSTENTNHVEEDPRKLAAAAVAEKLTASTSSAQMLSYVLSSLASEGVIGNARKEPSTDYPPEKRAKLENDQPYIPTHSPQLPPNPAYGHSESFQSNVTTVTSQLTTREPPPPPSSPPPLAPPLPPATQYLMPPYIPSAGPINSMPYGFNMSQQQQPPFPMTGMTPFPMQPTNPYQAYHQVVDGNLYSQPPTMPTTPMSRQ